MIGTLQLRRSVALVLAAVMFLITGPIDAARAALVTTEQAIAPAAQVDARARVAAFLARDDVRRQMVALGVDPQEAVDRVAGLSDAEVQKIAGHLDRLPAGGDAIVAIIGAAVLIFLVLLVTDLLGLTHIFPFVHHPR
jgi:cytochrome c1